MSQTWFISDTHFGHANILNFKTSEGRPVRDFESCEEMDEFMVAQWNELVHPADKVYHLGDVVISKKSLKMLDRLNGRKTLICGNHDIFNTKEYAKYFDNQRAYKMYPNHGFMCSHIPVHPAQLRHRFRFNVHGHLHSNQILLEDGISIDPQYVNICVEHTNFSPISFDDLLGHLELRKELMNEPIKSCTE